MPGERETLRRLIDAYSDDVVFHYFGESDVAGTYEGKEASVGALMTVSARAARTLIDVVDVLVGHELGAIVVHEQLSKGTHEAVVQRVFLYRATPDPGRHDERGEPGAPSANRPQSAAVGCRSPATSDRNRADAGSRSNDVGSEAVETNAERQIPGKMQQPDEDCRLL